MAEKGKEIEVSIIVPAYNEEENIPILMDLFARMFEESGLKGEVILVDDGSTDKTYERVDECQRQYGFLKVIRHRKNKGITDALFSGFDVAQGEIFIFFPADLQYDPGDIPKLVEGIYQGADIVTGWKVGRYERQYVSRIYNSLSRWLFKVQVHDLNSIKAFRREVVKELPLRKDWHRYMVVLAQEQGYTISEVKVSLYPRRYGKSKFGPWRVPVGLLDLIVVKFQISFMKKPMLLFGSVGGVFIILGLVVAFVAFYQRYVLQKGFRPLLYLVILLLLSGLLLFAMGFLAEAIANLHEELKMLRKK